MPMAQSTGRKPQDLMSSRPSICWFDSRSGHIDNWLGDIGQTIYLSVPPGLYLLMELALVWEANESLYRLKFILNVTDIFFYSHAFRYSAILKHDLNMSTLLTIVHFCDLKKKFHSVTPYLYFQA